MKILPRLRPILRGALARRLLEEVWNTKGFFELRCDLRSELPPIRPSKIAIEMRPADTRTFRGFHDELARSDSRSYLTALLRTWYCRAGVDQLYVAYAGDDPVYAQWLISPAGQRRIPRLLPGRLPPLRPDELLLEGAYTFLDYRRLGLMRDGMAQLLRAALETDAAAVMTYVAVDNVGSLRGCADVGFAPYHLRVSRRRLGLRRTRSHDLDETAWRLWEAATAKAEASRAAERHAAQA